MSDKIGLHRITNPSDSELAVSLHLYTVCEISSQIPMTVLRNRD
jgi:hypothetical protein